MSVGVRQVSFGPPQEDVVLLLRGLSKGDGKLVDEDGLRLPPKRGNMSSMKVLAAHWHA